MENRIKLLPLVQAKALEAKLDWKLADAIICQESHYNSWACCFEPGIDKFETPEIFAKRQGEFVHTEKNSQAISYGLFQLLGRTARSAPLKFLGPLPYLYDVETNLIWGMRYLAYIKTRYSKLEDIISAYNGGSALKLDDGTYKNQMYVNGVLGFIAKNALI